MKNKKFKLLIAIFVMVLAILACGKGDEAEPTDVPAQSEAAQTEEEAPAPVEEAPAPAVSLGDEFRSEEGGYAFNEIPGWTVDELFGFATMMSPDANDDSGPMIVFIGTLEEEDVSLDTFFDLMLDEFVDPDGEINASEPIELTVSGVPARSVEINGTTDDGVQMAGRITMAVFSPTQTFVMLGFAPTNRWEGELSPLYDEVEGSLSFFEAAPLTLEEMEPETVEPALVETRQWAVSAVASSEYSNPTWSAMQASGAPDTSDCGDRTTAWASSNSDGVDWLELSYGLPVIPTEINVYETYNPNQIVKVEVLDMDGAYHEVAAFDPQVMDCPYQLTIPVDNVDFEIVGVKLYIDQSILGVSWNEIDAVELVGLAAEGAAPPPAGGEAGGTDDPGEATFETPAGFIWHAGGVSGFQDDQLGVPDGMDVDSNGFLYVADRLHGIWFFNADGTYSDLLESDTFNNPTDVDVSTEGGGYIAVASWGSNNISVFDFNGNLLISFGSEGNGPGQFGGFSPQDLTLDLDNNIYVLDNNEDADGDKFDRVQVFDIDGNYLDEWLIEEDFFSAVSLKFWAGPTSAEDRIFVLGFIGACILEYDLQGNLIGKIGEETLDFTGPQDFDVDKEGNFYVAVWTPDSVMKLDHDGNLLDQWGVSVEDDTGGVPDGGFYNPFGIAVQPDGSQVYVSEWTGDYAYVTAFEFR